MDTAREGADSTTLVAPPTASAPTDSTADRELGDNTQIASELPSNTDSTGTDSQAVRTEPRENEPADPGQQTDQAPADTTPEETVLVVPRGRTEAASTDRSAEWTEVDHGLTNCQTPLAAPYIRKAAAHHRAKLAKAARKKTRSTGSR